ncbi:MAG: hypothetical protein MK108_11815 [Mariniblastus sp.]|nr:hypothetical protein [Mariniblastus sp.]
MNGNWQLSRGGKPYTIKGVGGNGSLTLLASCGGNSLRTWGVDQRTRTLLDEAHRNGISVALGIWLGQERQGFDYDNPQSLDRQTEAVLQAVRQYKDHPAILVWGIGNEMEGHGTGDNPKIWKHIEELCQRIKQEDPNHPVMSVIAEIGGNKLPAIQEHCPSLDIIGINSYAGAGSLPQRYAQAGGTKPYIVTEFGPPGTWEVGKNNLDSIDEPSSNQKAKTYLESYRSLQQDRKFCLGSYAFLWGNKQEGTPTWFGMLLPDGKKTSSVDVIAEQWSGRPLENLSPVIDELKIAGSNQVKGNELVKIVLSARDPEGDDTETRWVLLPDTKEYMTYGDRQATPLPVPDTIQQSSPRGATVKMPETSGLYRVYAYIDDGQGAAVANVVVKVDGKPAGKTGVKVKLPYVVYDEGDQPGAYVPSGWMGDTSAIRLDPQATVQPKMGETCLQCEFNQVNGWGGVVWQNPENDWGDKIGGLDLTGAKKLKFWVRGDQGGELVKFGFGLIGRDQNYYDTAKQEIEIRLDQEWQPIEIDLSEKELQRIKTGFYWVAAGQGEPIKFYIDRVVFE